MNFVLMRLYEIVKLGSYFFSILRTLRYLSQLSALIKIWKQMIRFFQNLCLHKRNQQLLLLGSAKIETA